MRRLVTLPESESTFTRLRPILESKGMCEIKKKKKTKKGQNRAKKGQNIWTFGQKCPKFENMLRKGR